MGLIARRGFKILESKVFCTECDKWVEHIVSIEFVTCQVKEKEYTLLTEKPRCMYCYAEVFHFEIDSKVQQLFFDLYRKDHHLPPGSSLNKKR